MAKKYELPRTFNIAVVGLSGTEKEKGVTGVGKSCLCNRFVRPLADDYHVDHISVLSQTDFSGRVVNNDHFLYWGEVTKTSDEGAEFVFQVIEHTEFIDDSSFQTFKSGKHDPYYKRVTNTKLCSAEKLMYICKNQLGIEKEYEQKLLPDGKFNVDGFVCTFDVSDVQGRSIEKQVEFTVLLLSHLLKTKKPVVLATTKHEEARDLYVREAEKLLTRKEIRGTSIPLIETSAHENINVELAFVAVAQLIDRAKGRSKIVPFYESARARKEVLDVATDAYQSLIRSQVTDYRAVWSSVNMKFSQNQDFLHYCEQFGQDAARNMFKRHVKKLKEEYIGRKMQMYIRVLPEVLGELLPDLASIGDGDWANVRERLKEHPDFHQYFLESPDEQRWQESDLVDSNETRIPFDILDTPEAESCFEEHRAALDADEQRQELRQEFKELLEETGLVTPGKLLSEVRVLFLGRECCERLSEQDLKEIYQDHQREITERAKHNFQELLLEQAELFYYFASIGPGNVLTQEDFNKITEALQEDSRYKALDRLGQDRMLMILQHLGFVHGPIREHCPANPNCMDTVVDKIIAQKAHRPSSWSRNSQWLLETENNQLNLVLLGSGGLAERLANAIKAQCVDNTFEVEKVHYTLDFRIIDGDVGLPQNSFRTTNFRPHGCFCVYANPQTLEYIRDSLEKTLLSNLEQEDRLPFHGLPIVILFAADATINEKDLLFLREEGQNRAKNLQCPFIDVSSAYEDNSEQNHHGETDIQRFEFNSLNQALRSLIESIQRRAGLLQIYHQLPDHAINPDIRILMCMLCGDPYQVEHVLGPLLSHQCCFVTAPHSVTLETYLGDSKRSVEVRVTSFHGANAFRDELVHGFILVYSTKRKASLATLGAFSNNIPNIPIQILAVSETDSAKDFFSSELSHQLITEGNAIADKLQAHFMTSTASMQQKTAFYTPFFKEVWDRKPQIEKAFHMEDSDYSVDSQRTPVPPPVPSRQESYHIRSGSLEDGGDSEGLYEQLPTDSGRHGILDDDCDEPLSPTSPYLDGSTGAPLSPSDDSDLYASVFHPGDHLQENGGDHLVKPSRVKNRRSLQAELYRQAFPSTESLDRSLSMKASLGREPPPLPPARQHMPPHFPHDRESQDPHSGGGIDLTFPPPMSTFSSGGSGGGPSGGGSPPPSYHHSQMHYSPRLLPHPLTSHHASHTSHHNTAASLYATNRRRPPSKGASTEQPHQAHQKTLGPFSRFELKKSNSLKSSPGSMPSAPSAPSLSGAGVFARNDLDVSDSITDDDEDEDDDDTLSSGLSGYGAYPPPPEPAPPDLPPPRLKKASSVGQSHPGHHASRTSLNEGWAENRIFERDYRSRTEEWLDNEVYHTYHSERQKTAPPTRPKPNNKPKPGKLNLKQFENLTDAINRLSTNNSSTGTRQGKHSHQVGATLAKMTGLSNAPLATPESIDLGTDYAHVKDAVQVYGGNPGDYSYSLVHNALSQESKPHRVRSLARRQGNREAFDKDSDSDSEWSSLERRQQRDVYSKVGRKTTLHKKLRKKRGIPVAPPRLPSYEGPTPPPLPQYHPSQQRGSGRGGGGGGGGGGLVAAQSLDPLMDKAKMKVEQILQCKPPTEEETCLITNIGKAGEQQPAVDKAGKKKEDRKKMRDDEKQEKRRQKEEERIKRQTEKKKKKTGNNATQGKGGPGAQPLQGMEDFVQSDQVATPLFVEKCIVFIEEEGLDSEGIYRVPGNRAHVDLLFQKFDEDASVSIRELDIPVNAVATALKDFFSKRLPPLLPAAVMDELTDIAGIQDKSCRLFALRDLLKKLPDVNFQILKYVFQHFVKVAENCRLNSMDSKNLAICWWPTLLPLEFNDMLMFERMRPHLEDSVQTMIDQFRFLFCDQEEVVMV